MEESLQLSMARTWAEINLDNLEKNIKVLKGLLIEISNGWSILVQPAI